MVKKKELQCNIEYRGPYFLKDHIPAHQIGVNTGAEVSWKPSLSVLSEGVCLSGSLKTVSPSIRASFLLELPSYQRGF